MLYRFFGIVLATILAADEPISSDMLLSAFKTNHAMAQNFVLESERLSAQMAAQRAGTPYAVFGSGAQAAEKNGAKRDTFEYAVGISKTFMSPHASELVGNRATLEAQIALMQSHRELIAYMYDLLELYHQSCLQRETVTLLEQFMQQLEALGKKNARAYELGEISKKDLILWELQQHKIALEFERKKSERMQLFRTLQGRFGSKLKISTLECSDLYAFALPEQRVPLPQLLSSRILELQHNLESIQSESHWIHEADVALSYENEMDVERFRAELSVPLEFTSDAHRMNAEAHRIAALQRENERVAFEPQMRKELQAGYIVLEQAYNSYTALEGPISEEAISLFEMTQTAYQSGESTAIELITIQQYVLDILMQIQQSKSAFYKALFEYYRLTITGKEFE